MDQYCCAHYIDLYIAELFPIVQIKCNRHRPFHLNLDYLLFIKIITCFSLL